MSLEVVDEDGFKSDTAKFTLDNRERKIAVPPSGAVLDIRLGYEDGDSWLTGEYTVDEIELKWRPDILIIGAKAADMLRKLKAPRSRSWHNQSIGAIVAAIAKDHNYKTAVADTIAGTVIPHIDQTEESDMHLLTRLAELLGCVFKPANGYLILAPRQELKSVTGKTLPPFTAELGKNVVGTPRYRSVERGKYQTVKARWRDIAGNTDVEVSVGTGEDPVYTIRQSYASADEAHAAAKAKKDALDRGTATLDLDVIGAPAARSERPLIPVGFGNVVEGATWVISRARHVFNNSGFSTSIEAEIKK